jgi:hypothetical protein
VRPAAVRVEVLRVLRALRVQPARRGLPDQQERRAQQALMAHREVLGWLVLKVRRVLPERRVLRVRRELPEHKVRLGLRVLPALKVRLARREQLDHKQQIFLILLPMFQEFQLPLSQCYSFL